MVATHAKQHTLLIGKEVTFGTAVTTDKEIGLIQSLSPSDKRSHTKEYTTGSREIQEIVAGLVDLDFDVELHLQNGRVFEYLIGAPTHALTGSDTKHTFDTIDSSLSSFTLEDSFNKSTDIVFNYAGCKIISAVISLDKDGILTFAGTGKCKTVDTSDATASAAIISSLAVLHYKHAAVSTGSAGSETSVGKIQTFSLTFANNTEPIAAAGQIEYQEFVEQNFDITFDFTMIFENKTEYDVFLGGTTPQTSPATQSIVFNANNGVTLGSGRREFNAQLANMQYEEVAAPVNVGEVVIATFRGNATTLGTDGVFYVDNVTAAAFS